MRGLYCTLALSVILVCPPSVVRADEVLLLVDDVPSHGIVAARVDLTGAAHWCDVEAARPEGIQACTGPDKKPLPTQFVPDAHFDPHNHLSGTLVVRLTPGNDRRLRLKFQKAAAGQKKPWDGTVRTASYALTHDPKQMGGLPTKITFSKTGKVFDNFRWNDRVYHREQGGFMPRYDTKPKVELVSQGPLCTAVRVACRYMQAGGKRPASQPEAVYHWYYFHDLPLAMATVAVSQKEPFTWNETHFLELNFPGEDFLHWAGGEPVEQGTVTASEKSRHFPDWGALVEGRDAVGMLDCGNVILYEGRTGYGTYLHAHGSAAWQPWSDTQLGRSAWLWMGSDDKPAQAIRAAAGQLPTKARVAVTVDKVRARIETAENEIDKLGGDARRRAWWRAAGARQLEAAGRFAEAVQAVEGKLPASWTVLSAGDLGMILERADDGVRLLTLHDSARSQPLSAPNAPPLFAVTVRNAKSKEEMRLVADAGWDRPEVVRADPAKGVEIRWQKPKDKRLGDLSVVARAVPNHQASAISWKLDVENPGHEWSVWRVVFPQVAVAELGPQAEVFVPRAAGQVEQGVWRRGFRFGSTYPAGWTTMQFMAAYDASRNTGLYVAMHDPLAGTKDIVAQSRPADRVVVLSFDHPAEDMGKAGNRFSLSGEAVWRVLRGDWFDAALVYRDWVRKHARWYPEMTADGRGDTPHWMRELPVWALASGTPENCETPVREFAKALGVPIGFHWYSWHQIPFDNDYPHYFPTKKGFAEAVARLQADGVFVMPYINGRLWDTRDKGMADFQFKSVALPATTKDEQGQPYTEMYGSKETDGSRVKLAAMCPTTDVWQKQVRGIVLRLFSRCGVKGVYIDQVAAARPRLCFDPAHGHPLGGGHWWTEGYWQLLNAIRKAMPKDRMLTTECNAEAYARWFDGYLTWHWQHDGQVPAFPAVYGGAIQMFGRAYRGGPTKDLALRMKAGQQYVFGEQIGWINPGVVREKENFAFLRQVVRLRWQLRRYFYAGQMARPPRLLGQIPTVKADWQWSGRWPVTTDAVMTGAWQLPKEKRLALLMVNVGDQPVSAKLDIDLRKYGLPDGEILVRRINPEAPGDTFTTPAAFRRDVTFPPHTAWAWELSAKQGG